jgi:hypothetical protein
MPFALQNEARGRTVGLCVDKSWAVGVGCENGHAAHWGAADLVRRFPREVTLEAIAARLKCATCGARSGVLGIRQDESPEARERQRRKDPGPPGFYRSRS